MDDDKSKKDTNENKEAADTSASDSGQAEVKEANTKDGVPTQPGSAKVDKKPKNWKKIALVAIFVLLLGVFGWLYWDQKSRADDLQAQLDTATAETETAEEAESGTEPATEAPLAEATGVCDEGSTYTASQSPVVLELDEDYAVVRKWDDGFEGGPVTILVAASCVEDSADNQNILESSWIGEVSVRSQPSNGSTEFNPPNPDITTEEDSITVDGKTAQVFVENGLFQTIYIFISDEGFNTTITGYRDGATGEFNELTQAVLEGLSL